MQETARPATPRQSWSRGRRFRSGAGHWKLNHETKYIEIELERLPLRQVPPLHHAIHQPDFRLLGLQIREIIHFPHDFLLLSNLTLLGDRLVGLEGDFEGEGLVDRARVLRDENHVADL